MPNNVLFTKKKGTLLGLFIVSGRYQSNQTALSLEISMYVIAIQIMVASLDAISYDLHGFGSGFNSPMCWNLDHIIYIMIHFYYRISRLQIDLDWNLVHHISDDRLDLKFESICKLKKNGYIRHAIQNYELSHPTLPLAPLFWTYFLMLL
eukprot:TRINITY_DN11256_c2_g1_i1.p1 TRINITY_DN11256_c2_g1~~TRINITY_DN11256_c2_g1_i1.p1  ORF type:complete len:150 (+),score=5.58 TRINITY_DN11256_c2_g1_i1:218-667(+)